ncbi:hypothetical protein [Sinorhizobium fredii]|uniref:hypothetical protein n=1 Tax=Rhizobium fredii TaxID=380 RepID=UPI00129762B9|nr:hypothetical protein [Sinorhizobium fredii]MQW94072.1 hypothetical protein [Sinorhizobium fredii]
MMLPDPYASGVLQEEHHSRLVADLENYARDAGIQPHWIWTPLPETVSDAEVAYLKNFRRHAVDGQIAGIAYCGKPVGVAIEQRMAALAGCLVRNFVRARLMTVGQVLDHLAKGTLPDLSCLLIPNFFLRQDEGGHIAAWQVQSLFDLLMARRVQGQQTILYVSDSKLLGKEYGLAISRLIDEAYLKITN